MEDYVYGVLSCFIEENWSAFENFCNERGEDAEAISKQIEDAEGSK